MKNVLASSSVDKSYQTLTNGIKLCHPYQIAQSIYILIG